VLAGDAFLGNRYDAIGPEEIAYLRQFGLQALGLTMPPTLLALASGGIELLFALMWESLVTVVRKS
jgi:hypothetical protein